jgi:ceramide glucosyltransferase
MMAASVDTLLLLAFAAWLVLLVAQLRLLAEPETPARNDPPPISILKPLKGADPDLEGNLESFFQLDYPRYEVVFSFASKDDPAFAVARRVADRNPNVEATFVIDPREPGANPKVCRLIAAERHARFGHVLVSDGDVRIAPGDLRAIAAELDDRSVGLVSNPFRGAGGRCLGARVEDLHFGAFVFAGTAAVSRLAGRPCVVGKSILLSREALGSIGGFAAVKDHLAEDFLLGDLVSREGYRVALSARVLVTHCARKTVRAFWDRQLRWARMRRRLAGPAYFAEALASPIPWLAITAVAGGFAAPGWLLLALAVYLAGEAVRLRGLGVKGIAPNLPLVVLKDFLFFGVFWASLASYRTQWRGKSVELGERTLIVDPAAEEAREIFAGART